jgi:SnoaL-like domain
MAEDPNITIAKGYFDALLSKDFRLVPLATNVVMESPVTPKLCGLESVLEFLDGLASVVKEVKTGRVIAQDDTVVVEFEIETDQGAIAGFQCFDLSNGQITKLRPYFDARPLTEGNSPGGEPMGDKGCKEN